MVAQLWKPVAVVEGLAVVVRGITQKAFNTAMILAMALRLMVEATGVFLALTGNNTRTAANLLFARWG